MRRSANRTPGHVRFGSSAESPHLEDEDLAQLQKSTTPHLRTLSKLDSEDLSIHSPEEQVVGLSGRRKLQRSGSVKPKQGQSQFASSFSSSRWMDVQRKHLQAYEYLCHIGEARGWIEDVLTPQKLPPIVQLEEALRDGVTLAEVVVTLAPALSPSEQRALGNMRIFRSPRLQFRHSDNIALFFRFLAEAELPELFRFELVDLYEKKNIPKVIYCIHALSWLLYRKGIVDFTIGNLVGQLQFEDHELAETQKNIDRSNVPMPSFAGMAAKFEVEEPPPPPPPTEDEQLAEQEEVIADLQSQMRGALVRMQLGGKMQALWDSEDALAELQAIIRGGFAREIFDFKFVMNRSTTQFQAAAKAYLVRRQLHRKQRAWRDQRAEVVKLQSLWRGRQQRAETKHIRTQLQRQRHGLKDFQAAIRGALARWNVGDQYHLARESAGDVEAFQAAVRGALARMEAGRIMNALWEVEPEIEVLQATIRGAQQRKKAKGQKAEARQAAVEVAKLQAAVRGLLQRRAHQQKHGELMQYSPTVANMQVAARGLLSRLRHARTIGGLSAHESKWTILQSALRARQVRQTIKQQKAQLLVASDGITKLQAAARASLLREWNNKLQSDLARQTLQTVVLQGFARGYLERRQIGLQFAGLEDQETKITELQALARAAHVRTKIYDDLCYMQDHEAALESLQGMIRAMILRRHIGTTLAELEDHEDALVELQAAMRACNVRRKFVEKKRHYKENMQKVIKLQSFVRGKQQGESYKSLVNGKNPPLPVLRRHLHLLTDSGLEFEGEIEAERLRRQVIESVRRNELVESYVEGLDVKIALLVKNKITLDEVVKHQKHFGGSANQLLRSGSTLRDGRFDLKALNASSRKKLTGYEELFFLLQTQPNYLARLFSRLTAQGLAEKEGKNLERLTQTLFGYAQKSREEYLLLKLVAESAHFEASRCRLLPDYLRLQPSIFAQRLFLSYVRSPRDRAYLKSSLGPLVKEGICGQADLDLEFDPLMIHRALVNNEELSTGRVSHRPKELPREEAIRQLDVRAEYIAHLQDLRDLCDSFFLSLEETLHRMPYGIRFVASQLFAALCDHFRQEQPEHLAQVVGSWLWKSYLHPALKEPEMWGVVDRGLSPVHKRNLASVSTVLGQVAAGRLFGQENVYLQPLNSWVSESLGRWNELLQHLFDIPPAEQHFDADQFSDLYSRTKPTLYIKLADIFALHSLISSNLADVAPSQDDPVREVVRELGSAKNNETDLGSASSSGGEITLTLKSRFTVQDDPDAETRALFTATKRLVLYIIRIQTGTNLLEILVRPITYDDDEKWAQLVEEEMRERSQSHQHRRQPDRPRSMARRNTYEPSVVSSMQEDEHQGMLDLDGMSYAELKRSCLENILALEQTPRNSHFHVSRENAYQDLLNALASDIRLKHRRRLERQREVDTTRLTLAQLDQKAEYLEEQLKSYNDYIEQALHTLASKKGKGNKFVIPFTKQWSHEKELQRSGRQPKFGSYKYSARQLADKGVLLQWMEYAPDSWNSINIVISSDEVGVFHVEASSGSMMVPGASANLLLDDLLQAQYDGRQSIDVFAEGDGRSGAKLGVNLLLHLVFKKFYRDE